MFNPVLAVLAFFILPTSVIFDDFSKFHEAPSALSTLKNHQKVKKKHWPIPKPDY